MKIKEGLILQEEESDAILFDPETLLTAWLNESGIIIWRCLEKNMSDNEIIKTLESNFEIKVDNLREDLKKVLTHLKQNGFIIE